MPGFKWHECPRCRFWFDCDLTPTHFTTQPGQPPIVQSVIPDGSLSYNRPPVPSTHFTAPPEQPPPIQSAVSDYSHSYNRPAISSTGGITPNIPVMHGPPVVKIKTENDFQRDIGNWNDSKAIQSTFEPEWNIEQHSEQNGKGQTGKARLSHPDNMDIDIPGTSVNVANSKDTPGELDSDFGLFPSEQALHQHLFFDQTSDGINCTKCKMTFYSEKELANHMAAKHKTKGSHCQKCGREFKTKQQMYDHARRSTCSGIIYSCAVCLKSCSDKGNIRRHIAALHTENLDCLFCGLSFNDKNSLAKHEKKIHENIKIFKCSQCGKECSDLPKLKEHSYKHKNVDDLIIEGKEEDVPETPEREEHDRQNIKGKFSCAICSKSSNNKQDLRRHISTMHNEVEDCCVCGNTFPDRNTLIAHRKTHSDDKSFTCLECSKEYTDLKLFIIHSMRHKNVEDLIIKWNENVVIDSDGGRNPKRDACLYSCAICSKGENDRTNMRRHIVTMHSESHDCCVCGQNFSKKKALQDHMKRHQNDSSFKCLKCEKEFPKLEILHVHAMIHKDVEHLIINNNSEPEACFRCALCSKRCLNRQNMRRHVVSMHSENPCCCVCGQVFAEKKTLLEHINEHEKENIFRCFHCDKEFTELISLRKHALNHNKDLDHLIIPIPKHERALPTKGEIKRSQRERFRCSFCPQTGSDKQNMRRHIYSMHIENRDCCVCGEHFSNKDSLIDHMKVHQNDRIFNCLTCNKEFYSLKKLNMHRFIHENLDHLIVFVKKHDSIPSNNDASFAERKTEPIFKNMKERCVVQKVNQIQATDVDNITQEEAVLQPRVFGDLIQVKVKEEECEIGDYNDDSSFINDTNIKKEVEMDQMGTVVEMARPKYVKGKAGNRKTPTPKKNLSFKCPKCSSCFATRAKMLIHHRTHIPKAFHCVSCKKSFRRKIDFITHKKYHDAPMTCSCPICNRMFRLPTFLKSHMANTHKLLYDCRTCKKWFANEYDFEKHFDESQCVKLSFECSLCAQGFLRKDLLFRHHKTHRGLAEYKCRQCDKVYHRMTDLYDHSRKHARKEHMCPHCAYMARHRATVDRHIQLKHTMGRPIACKLCPKRYKTESCLQSHMRLKHTERPRLLCPICPASYTENMALKCHLKWHKTEHPYECHVCTFKSITKGAYENHFDASHPDQLPYVCSQCPDSFEVETELRDHLREIHGRMDISQDRQTCQSCGRTFVFKRQLELHLLSHQNYEKLYKCTLCDARYVHQLSLEAHYAKKHPDGKKVTFDCLECGKGFKAKGKLSRHMASVHATGRTVTCTEPGCSKAFKTHGDMKDHIKRMHRVVEKNFPCSECEKIFATAQNLKLHFRVHSGEKPYHCNYCSYSCSIKGNLDKHVRQVHKKE